MIESVLIGILFVAALYYLFTLLKHNFKAKEDGCAKGCGTCSSTQVKSDKKATSTSTSGIL